MEKFDLYKVSAKIKCEDGNEVTQGCTDVSDTSNCKAIKSFTSLEEAKIELKKYHTEVEDLPDKCKLVTEYKIRKNKYDDNGNLVSRGRIFTYSDTPENEGIKIDKFAPNFYCRDSDHYLFSFEKNIYDTYDEAKARLVEMFHTVMENADKLDMDDIVPRIVECYHDGFLTIPFTEHEYTLEKVKSWEKR